MDKTKRETRLDEARKKIALLSKCWIQLESAMSPEFKKSSWTAEINIAVIPVLIGDIEAIIDCAFEHGEWKEILP